MKWRDIPSSKSLRRLIQAQLDMFLPSVNGYCLVNLGELSCAFDFSKAAVANVLQFTTDCSADVCSDPHQLPLSSDDIDAIFIPLLIEQSTSPHQLLREAARVLRPGGKLLIVTINPFSLWGLYKLLKFRSQQKFWTLPFYTRRRIIDWLTLLGLEVSVEHSLFSKRPGSEYSSKKNYLSSDVYSTFGAINFLLVEKKVRTLTMIKPHWKTNKVTNVTALGPVRKDLEDNS